MTNPSPFLEMRAISKGFPGVQALSDVSFDVNCGEVHALVGENGAGKSTLIKILGGVYQPDAGEIALQGRVVQVKGPRHAQELGISLVYQELNLFQNLSIAENIHSGRMPHRGLLGFEDRKTARKTAFDYLEKFDIHLDPATPVSRLSIAQQQVVEIAKALARQARVLILDEPTSSLTEHETKLLFKTICQLRSEGLCIIYISHRLEEIFEIADRVTVLRDGCLVGTRAVAASNVDAVIRMMVGRKLEDLYGSPEGGRAEEVLRVEGLGRPGKFQEVSFNLYAGEIVGMAGLIGAGRTEVGLALFGALPYQQGAIYLNGQRVEIHSPHQAMALGLAYISENRTDDALFLNMNVQQNISVSHLGNFAPLGLIRSGLETQEAQAFIQRLNIQTPSSAQKVMKLSGGNQQKVILARWLAIHPKVFIVDEPTRGIDVGAKMEIYTLLHKLAAQGVAILLISSEMPEILGMSDRILVMHAGRITGELSRAEAAEEKIMTLAAY